MVRNRLVKLVALLALMLLCFTGCGKQKAISSTLSIGKASDLSGHKVAVCQGTIYDQVVLDAVEDAEIEYYANYADMLTALNAHKVDAFVGDTPSIKFLSNEANSNCVILPGELNVQDIGAIFAKTPEGEELCKDFNEFIKTLSDSGKLAKLKDKWIDSKDPSMDVDIDSIPNTEGRVIRFATESLNPPFAYMKDGKVAGYEIELAALYCLDRGYGLEISDLAFGSIIPGVTEGSYDMAGSSISITKERQESVNFSTSLYRSGASVVIRKSDLASTAKLVYQDFDELNGKRVGVLTGSVTSEYVEQYLPESIPVEFSSISDLAVALENGKVDAYAGDYPMLYLLKKEYENQGMMDGFLVQEEYGYILNKNSERSQMLCQQMNEFLAKISADGTMADICKLWFDDSDEARSKEINLDLLTGENGTIKFCMSTAIGAPMAYILNGEPAGYDVDIVYQFCKEYGYDLEIDNAEFSGLLAGVAGGKYDMGGSCITITEERKSSMLMTDANFSSGTVIVCKSATTVNKLNNGFLGGIAESFDKTFIREQRWKLFLSGIGSTMFITVASIVFGTLLGFAVYLEYKRQRKIFNKIVDFFAWLLEGMPTVVLLMILFYIVFAKAPFSGTWVAIFGFTMTFAVSVLGMLDAGVASIDKGQTEAALALGYTPRAAFFKMVMPQAAQFFLPLFKSEIVSLIKGTAVVGYIAVQDLTKMGDIIRSRTYEAFFPLIVTAIIYFILAGILTKIVSRIQFRIDPKKRDVSKLLEGDDKK